ncbi:unnamed protein product [Cylicostephanus goldi]|uniref:Uncharacterized protein n=1 Tax=Cylicostephanus goldi TaxID=71465 RepID=A0A3P7MZ23_CYLGO|nr:unnamed protein product [Cylicostephanus goldi]
MAVSTTPVDNWMIKVFVAHDRHTFMLKIYNRLLAVKIQISQTPLNL